MDDPTAEALYLGEGSATADMNALARAKEMETGGRSREEILNDTGWFRLGPRLRWNYETDDRDFRQLQPLPREEGQFFDYFDSPAFNAAYPDLVSNLRLYRYRGAPFSGDGGEYQPLRGVGLPTNDTGYKSGPENAALHELQHAADDAEGTFSTDVPKLIDAETRA